MSQLIAPETLETQVSGGVVNAATYSVRAATCSLRASIAFQPLWFSHCNQDFARCISLSMCSISPTVCSCLLTPIEIDIRLARAGSDENCPLRQIA